MIRPPEMSASRARKFQSMSAKSVPCVACLSAVASPRPKNSSETDGQRKLNASNEIDFAGVPSHFKAPHESDK